jgi:major vault protein
MKRNEVLFSHEKAMAELEIKKAKELADIEASKFKDMVESIGPETIAAMASAGPEMQAKLLEGLGLQGYIMTDGNNPINLFNTASGLVGGVNPVN